MNPETFFDNFGLLADTPDGVQKLRELILQLAVRGKLVPQDSNDEPAAVLLKRIRTANNKMKKSLPKINKDDTLYELPKLWEWVRLGEIVTLEYGKNLPKSKRNQYGEYPVYGSNGIVGYHDNFLIDEPAIIVGRKGSAGALNISSEPSWPTDVSYYLIPPDSINLNFAFILLKSLKLETLGKGIKPGVNRNEAYQLITSLPPLNEQRRIVAKVDQLMALCGELEARQQKKQEARLHLNSAALDKLLTAHEPDKFAHHWQRICDNFDLLYGAPETVGELRKAILQLAVQGKLVRQDPNDGPAAVLLEKIRDEKERLIKEKKIRKPKPLSLNDFENPYELPVNWEWTRLFDIGVINPRNEAKDDMDVSFIPMALISETYSTPVSSERRHWGIIKTGFTHFAEEDVVLAKITPCFQNGKSAVMRGLLNGLGAGTTELHVFRPLLNESVNPDYVLLYLRSPQFLTEGIKRMTGTAGQKRVPRDYFAGSPFPFPPFQEQRRIVAKVDQLMALCDDLESKLKQSQTDGEILMEAVVHQLVAA